MNILLGMKTLWIFSGVITKLGYIGVISMHFRIFSKGQGTESAIFFEIPDIYFGMNGRCWARAYAWGENESTPPSPRTQRPCT